MVDFVVGKDDDFGKTLARGFNCEYRSFKQDLYPDGEPYPIIEADYHEMRGKEVIFAPRSSASSELRNVALELHIYQRIVASLAAQDQYDSRLDLVYPYFWLARQDHNPRLDKEESIRRRDKGKDVGYQYIIKAFKALGARRIVTVNPHFHRTEGSFEVAGAEIISVTGI